MVVERHFLNGKEGAMISKERIKDLVVVLSEPNRYHGC